MTWEPLDHTADAGVRAWADTREKLYGEVAAGMFSIVCNADTVEERESLDIEVDGHDQEEQLIAWLREILFRIHAEGWLFKRAEVTSIEGAVVKGKAFGEPLDPERHEVFTEVKAVTYHALSVTKTSDRWEATVVFDL